MNTQKNWYAVYTRPRWEKKVAEGLGRRKIEYYCPFNKIVRQWSDRKKTVLEPLFSSYVFVNASEAEHLAIKQTDGVINLVYWLGAPAIIKPEEIEAIRQFLEEHNNVRLEKIAVNVSDRVRITEGVFMHHEGSVVEVKNKTVKLLLPSLGYTMVAEVAKEKIEILNFAKGVYAPQSPYGLRVV